MVRVPVEVLDYTLVGVDKVKFELRYGTDLGALTGYLDGSNYGITYSSMFGDSLLDPSYISFDGSNYGPS